MDATGLEQVGPTHLTRRQFVRSIAASALPLTYALQGTDARSQEAHSGAAAFPGMIVREHTPENLEFPFAMLDSFLTPTERFYVRNHFPVPPLEARTWKLKIEGAVRRPIELTYEDLLKMPGRTKVTMLECAGNSRVFLVPKANGVLWELGAVGNAEWTGVPLAAVLERAGLGDRALEVILEGADEGEIRSEPKSPGKIRFARSLPLEKARRPDVLLAYKMNGHDLTPAHGYPVRALVPGWYGMASIKWLTRIVVTDRPFDGYFQTFQYAYFDRRAGLPTLVPITENQVKAEIARPARQEVVPAGTPYRIHGAAWAGEAAVAKVEVSTDHGKTWAEARLLDKPIPHAWRLWEHRWQTPTPAKQQVVMARATDTRGRTQPLDRDPDRRNTMISHVLPIEIEVR